MNDINQPFESPQINASLGEEIALKPAGVYDAELQLTDEQVIEMKQRFRREPELIGSVAVHIVDRLLPPSELDGDDPWFESVEELEEFKTDTAIGWAELLEQVVVLPGSEWPEHVTPPATFALALEELETQGKANG